MKALTVLLLLCQYFIDATNVHDNEDQLEGSKNAENDMFRTHNMQKTSTVSSATNSIISIKCYLHNYECDFGFIRSEGSGHCIRNTTVNEDPYRIPLDCQPGEFYKRTKGYRKIEGNVCVGGYENHYMPEEIPCPYYDVQDFLIFAERTKINRFNLITASLEELPVKQLENVIAIEYDMNNDCVYWSDIELKKIMRQCLNDTESEDVVSSNLGRIEGIALDWISNNLYFVDTQRKKIELVRTDSDHSEKMRTTILNSTVLSLPRGVAVHPKAGYMFWTDWSVQNASINRADLDGQNVKKLFGKPDVVWPNCVTIDYITERIYWVDAKLDYIASSNLHGDLFKLIISDKKIILHPFSIAVFKDNMYWDDWKLLAISSANKDGVSEVKVLRKNLTSPMDLKVYGHGIQVGTNACTNTTCPFVCVGKPQNQSSCLCPDGWKNKNDICFRPLANVTYHPTITKFTTCQMNEFTCGDGICRPRSWRCDNEQDCPDGSDEKDCLKLNCTKDEFTCDNGQCIYLTWRCDGEVDCVDTTDEQNCNQQQCSDEAFRCKAGDKCIPSGLRCDGTNDCSDGSDEINCNSTIITITPSTTATTPTVQNATCRHYEFKCGNEKCLPYWWQCDTVDDCGDGSDEINCPGLRSSPYCHLYQYRCGNGDCILTTSVCDGKEDCKGGEDERQCCTKDEFKCIENGHCISRRSVCNQVNDCPGGTNEMNCNSTTAPSSSCSVDFFSCGNGRCLPLAVVCDGRADCSDGSDEFNCKNHTRLYHMLQMWVECGITCYKCGINESSLLLHWSIVTPSDGKLEFLPSISKDGTDQWHNGSWVQSMEYHFTNLDPATKYNMTIYVREQNTSLVLVPAKYLISHTVEGTPSIPVNVTAVHKNNTHVLLSWKPPEQPNGQIINYQIYWSPPFPEKKLKLDANETSHLILSQFEPSVQYSFYVTALNNKHESELSEVLTLRLASSGTSQKYSN